MTPTLFLTFLLTTTLAASVFQLLQRHRRVRELKDLAAQWHMHYSARDRFQLAARVAELLPVPGAAAVRVIDLIYGIEGDHYRYLLTAEFTTGVLRAKSRGRIVTSFSEPRDRSLGRHTLAPIFAPERLSPLEQYRHLHEHVK